MLWIGLIVGIIFVIAGCIFYWVEQNTSHDTELLESLSFFTGGLFAVISLIAIIFMAIDYNNIKSTSDAKIAVLEERNELVLSQIEPLIQKYLNYESETYGKFKPDAQTLVAFSAYPELKGNEFVQKQISIILYNQNEITKLKLKKVELKRYKLWLWVES